MPTFHSLTSGGTTTDAASYLTEIVAPTANRLVLISINCYLPTGSVQPPQPTVTGNGITYALVDAQDVDTLGTDRSTMWVFRGMNSAPTAGPITIDFGGTTVGAISWNVSQSSADVDTSGTNGSGAIVQAVGATSATTVTASPAVTFSPAMTAGNAGYFACGTQTAQVQTPRSGWVELGDVATVAICGLEVQYKNGTDTDGSSTWTTLARAGAILVEVKAGAASPNGYIAGHASSATGSVTTLPGVTHTTPILNDIEILAHASDATQTLAIDGLFTQLLNLVDGSLRAYLGWNVSDGTETGDVSISSTATANRQVGALATFRGYTGIAGTASLAEAATDSSHDSPSYTPINTGSLVGFIYYERATSSTVAPQTPPGGLIKAVEFGTSGSGGTYIQIAYKDTGVVAGVAESPGAWASAVATGNAYVFAFELTPATVSVTLGRATEADTVSPLTLVKAPAVGQSTETDASPAVVLTKTITLGQAAETETVAALVRSKTAALGQAGETDTTSPLVLPVVTTLGQATEADSGLPLALSKTVTLGQAAEADDGQTLALSKSRPLNSATETDTALAVTTGAAPTALDITVTVGPTRVRSLVTVGPTRPGIDVGATRGGIEADGTRDRPLVTVAATRTGLTAGDTRTGLEVDETRTSTEVGPTRRDRGA